LSGIEEKLEVLIDKKETFWMKIFQGSLSTFIFA